MRFPPFMGLLLAGLALLGSAAATPLIVPPDAPAAPIGAWGQIAPLTVDVDHAPVGGYVALPTQTSPHTLIVFCHHLGSDAESYRDRLEGAQRLGAIGLVMGSHAARVWDVDRASKATVEATQYIHSLFPSVDNVVIVGYSLGGEVSGVAVARAPPGTFDHWIVAAGVMDLTSEWRDQPAFRGLIEAETDGPPSAAPSNFAALSPFARVDAIAHAGLADVVLLHGQHDFVVPYSQAHAMYDALTTRGVPVRLYAVKGPPPLPCAGALCQRTVPSGHEAGSWGLLRPFVEQRLEPSSTSASSAEGVYDGLLQKAQPADQTL